MTGSRRKPYRHLPPFHRVVTEWKSSKWNATMCGGARLLLGASLAIGFVGCAANRATSSRPAARIGVFSDFGLPRCSFTVIGMAVRRKSDLETDLAAFRAIEETVRRMKGDAIIWEGRSPSTPSHAVGADARTLFSGRVIVFTDRGCMR